MSTTCIIGWGHTPFGKHAETDVEGLIVAAGREALDHAGLAADAIDMVIVGHFNAGFSPQSFPSSLALGIDPALRFKPALRVENACATGSAAVETGMIAIESKRARYTLVIGVEQMSKTPPAEVGRNLLKASYVKDEGSTPGGFAGLFGRIADAYFQRYGDQSDALARIASKNHRNGCANPYAQMRKDLGYEFCRTESEKNPLVAGPLKRTDCSLVSDGAAALVLAGLDEALAARRAVAIRGFAHVNDTLPLAGRDIVAFEGCRRAWQHALGQTRLTLEDLSFVETHDCFTIAELIEYEAMGLAAPGQAARLLEEGVTEMTGRLPVNPSGGLKAKGHPVGATGVSMHVLGAMQLTGAAGEMQIENARLAGIFNMGGAAVANYVSLLERIR
jgi:acetyl-CoA C-acetyltransferase